MGRWYADGMVRREIDFDEETDRMVAELAQQYSGDAGQALAELVHAHESLELFVDQCEEAHRDSLVVQRESAESGFRNGRFTSWDEVKRRNGL
ncbi:MAG: hypothetical protein ACR2NN_12385 [Bryobacteraceae bacterium]